MKIEDKDIDKLLEDFQGADIKVPDNLDEKLNEKFMQTKMYEKYVKSFVEKGGMTLKAKLCLTVPVSLLLLFMFITIENTMMRMIIIIMWLTKVIVFTRMKTIKVETNREAYDGQ